MGPANVPGEDAIASLTENDGMARPVAAAVVRLATCQTNATRENKLSDNPPVTFGPEAVRRLSDGEWYDPIKGSVEAILNQIKMILFDDVAPAGQDGCEYRAIITS